MPRKKSSHGPQPQPSPVEHAAPDVTLDNGTAPPDAIPPEAPDVTGTRPPAAFPHRGHGASAGGLAAFEAFFRAMSAETDRGIAFVLVQHLAPDHSCLLRELIQRDTHMREHVLVYVAGGDTGINLLE